MFHMDQRNPRLGRGLGLAISKGFVDLMVGSLRADDTPGGGTTMAVSLAAERPAR
jgi:two-component system sensor histidine kinase KdpD